MDERRGSNGARGSGGSERTGNTLPRFVRTTRIINPRIAVPCTLYLPVITTFFYLLYLSPFRPSLPFVPTKCIFPLAYRSSLKPSYRVAAREREKQSHREIEIERKKEREPKPQHLRSTIRVPTREARIAGYTRASTYVISPRYPAVS